MVSPHLRLVNARFRLDRGRPADSCPRDLGLESTFGYGARIGAARVLRLFDDYDVKANGLEGPSRR